MEPERTRVRKSTAVRAARRIRALARAGGDAGPLLRSLRATFAHWSHADSFRLREKTLRAAGILWTDGPSESEGP
jgi:hypothetical protein